ncbi:MAG: hypothetical protein ACLGHV_13385, partial [Gammaproteobacteria bacterium]
MGQTNRRTSAWPALAVVLAVSFSALPPAAAADSLRAQTAQLVEAMAVFHTGTGSSAAARSRMQDASARSSAPVPSPQARPLASNAAPRQLGN